MKYLLHIVIVILFQYLCGQAIIPEEKLTYKAGFRFVAAGESTLELKADTLNGKFAYKITSIINSNSFLDIFYKVRDKIEIWIDRHDLSLLKMKKNIQEGKFRDNKDIEINYSDSNIRSDDKKIYLSQKVFDPISIIYFLRNQALSIENQFILPTFNGKIVREIALTVTSHEEVKVPAGKFDCILVAPSSVDGSQLLKNNGEMKIWFSNDSLKLPIKIEQQTNIGTMLLELKSSSRPKF